MLCGQGPAPAAASVASYRALGLELVPGTGYLAACVPGAFDAWMTLLRDYGTWEFADVAAFAIGYARDGFPSTPGIARAIAALEPSWTTSVALWSQTRPRLRNPLLADTYERLTRSGGATREARIDAARDAWYRGWVAEAIVDAVRVPAVDSSGEAARRRARRATTWRRSRATWEEPAALDFRGWTVFKTGPWGQGPVFLQQLALLDGSSSGRSSASSTCTRVIEGAKLAFADREAFYGDRRRAAGAAALARLRRRAARADRPATRRWSCGRAAGGCRRCGRARRAGAGVGEPTRGDTCHLDVADRWGNLVSATPSGGWLQSSPAIPGLGFCLGTRAQMFWLEDGLPASLVGGRRPRTTLSPSLARHEDGTVLAFGTPGGDQQDQWSLEFFLAHAVFGLDLQAAIDAPMFHTTHFPSSFYPREAEPGRVEIEGRAPAATIAALRERGHDVVVVDDWSLGRLSAISRAPDGVLRGAANPRGMQGYAVGR